MRIIFEIKCPYGGNYTNIRKLSNVTFLWQNVTLDRYAIVTNCHCNHTTTSMHKLSGKEKQIILKNDSEPCKYKYNYYDVYESS